MAYDKLVDSTVLDGYFTNIGNAIRSKNGKTNKYMPSQMPSAINAIQTGVQVKTKSGTVTIANGDGYNNDIFLDIGFIPDVVFFKGEDYSSNSSNEITEYNGTFCFINSHENTHFIEFYDVNGAYLIMYAYIEGNGIGFMISAYGDNSYEAYNGILQYTAYKFT